MIDGFISKQQHSPHLPYELPALPPSLTPPCVKKLFLIFSIAPHPHLIAPGALVLATAPSSLLVYSLQMLVDGYVHICHHLSKPH